MIYIVSNVRKKLFFGFYFERGTKPGAPERAEEEWYENQYAVWTGLSAEEHDRQMRD